MTIKFYHPPTGTANPFHDFDPQNRSHYPSGEGLYICGIKARVDGVLKFIPTVVGEGNLLRALYKRHYDGKYLKAFQNLTLAKPKTISEKKEIWDFSKGHFTTAEIIGKYNDMHSYDGLPSRGRNLPAFFGKIIGLKNLLYFQNIDYLNHKFGLGFPVRNISSDEAVKILANVSVSPHLQQIAENYIKLILTLGNFSQNFYYVYASESNQQDMNTVAKLKDEKFRKAAEHQLKQSLKSINIHTTADDKKIQIGDELEFDLTNIQGQLVNTGEHSFDGNGEYKDLILR
jgi:hypothetical protein